MVPSIITDQIDQDLEKALSIIQKKGYSFVELHNVFGKSIEACTFEEVQKIKTLLKKYNMKVSNIGSTVFFLCPLYDGDQVSLFNDSFYAIKGDVQMHLKALKNACWIAQELNCTYVRIFPFRFPDNRKPPFGDVEDQQRILHVFKEAVQLAEAANVILVLENCPYSHLPKGSMTKEIVEKIHNPHLQLLWDPANSYRAIIENVPRFYQGKSLLEELDEIYPYIGHMHIKDYHYDPSFSKPFLHKALKKGDIDYDSIFSYLMKMGYTKALSLEPEVPFDEACSCMETLKNCIKKVPV